MRRGQGRDALGTQRDAEPQFVFASQLGTGVAQIGQRQHGSRTVCLGIVPPQLRAPAPRIRGDSNRPTSCVYGPSAGLDQTLEEIMPLGSEIASLQFENGMDAAVNLSRPVAALVEAWASGSSWDQVRRDTNLDEGDIARGTALGLGT